ncbi:MAG: hypothetical protein ACE5GM_04755, partial [bacterium]
GTTSCVAGSVVDSCTPGTAGTETCNGIDDDCDGVVDNNCGSGSYDNLADELRNIANTVAGFDCNKFKKEECKYREKLEDKIKKIAKKLDKIDDEDKKDKKVKKELEKALEKLQDDVLKYIDGCTNDNEADKDDLLVDCSAQVGVYDNINTVINSLQAAIANLGDLQDNDHHGDEG